MGRAGWGKLHGPAPFGWNAPCSPLSPSAEGQGGILPPAEEKLDRLAPQSPGRSNLPPGQLAGRDPTSEAKSVRVPGTNSALRPGTFHSPKDDDTSVFSCSR